MGDVQKEEVSTTGLDMYLYAERYVPGWEHRSEDERRKYNRIVRQFGMEEFVTDRSPSVIVRFTVAYWRKANAIHGWFVREVQDGKDECLPHDVGFEQLKDLRALCEEVLLFKEKYGEEVAADRGMTLLPPVEGFFFGVYDIGEWYWEDLEDTVAQLDRVLALPREGDDSWKWSLTYRSSW